MPTNHQGRIGPTQSRVEVVVILPEKHIRCQSSNSRTTKLLWSFQQRDCHRSQRVFCFETVSRQNTGHQWLGGLFPALRKVLKFSNPCLVAQTTMILVRNDAPVLLFSASKKHSKRAADYIRSGEQRGYNTRFLTKNRNPWYKTERREPAPLLLGVFSRGGYKIIRNQK